VVTPIKEPDGTWVVFDGHRWQRFQSHAAAWRWIDRHEGQPISRSEKVSDWLWHQGIGDL
jgi:hypothetical protein